MITVIGFLALLYVVTNADMTCTTPFAYSFDGSGFSNYKIACCQNSGFNTGIGTCATPNGADYYLWCNGIFPGLGNSPSLCNCLTMCSGQAQEAPIPNGTCVGACTCTGACCDDGAPCAPTASPTKAPTKAPTKSPTVAPTAAPTKTPTKSPTAAPTTASPTVAPTKTPTKSPTAAPTQTPTVAPTQVPLGTPTDEPSSAPTEQPSAAPTKQPSAAPTTSEPTEEVTDAPTIQGESGLGIAMGLIFGPIGVMIVGGILYVVYLTTQVPKRF